MRINVAIPEEHVGPDTLNAALEAVTRLDEALIAQHAVPVFKQAVDRVRWKPEPPGDEHFDHAAKVLQRGWGDCDDLAPWHAASLRAQGIDRGAKAVVKKTGPKRWHALVQRSDGRIEDPSRAAGMAGPGSAVISGLAPMIANMGVVGSYVDRPALAVRPTFDQSGQHEAWECRTDLPWHWMPGKTKTDIAMVSLHKAPSASQAIVGAVRGAMRLGEVDSPANVDAILRLNAVSAAVCGMSHDELVYHFGDEIAGDVEHIVGSIFSKLAHTATNIVKKVTHKGASVAKTAAHITGPILRSPIAEGIAAAIPGVGPGVAATMAAAGYGMKLLDEATKTAKAIAPEAALALHAAGKTLHFVHEPTGKQVVVKPPEIHPVTKQPTLVHPPESGKGLQPQSARLNPAAMPKAFTAIITPQ